MMRSAVSFAVNLDWIIEIARFSPFERRLPASQYNIYTQGINFRILATRHRQ